LSNGQNGRDRVGLQGWVEPERRIGFWAVEGRVRIMIACAARLIEPMQLTEVMSFQGLGQILEELEQIRRRLVGQSAGTVSCAQWHPPPVLRWERDYPITVVNAGVPRRTLHARCGRDLPDSRASSLPPGTCSVALSSLATAIIRIMQIPPGPSKAHESAGETYGPRHSADTSGVTGSGTLASVGGQDAAPRLGVRYGRAFSRRQLPALMIDRRRSHLLYAAVANYHARMDL
jgi:hypothetical protein